MLDELDAPVERIVVTHMHPDHVGGARDMQELTGAPVLQGREDYAQCVARGARRDPPRFVDYWVRHGMPGPTSRARARVGAARRRRALGTRPELLDAGDEIDGWRVEVLPGHADGHIVLLRDGVMIAGDTILDGITPAIGLYPNSRPDPLGDYLESLQQIEELAPRVAYTGHRDPVLDPGAEHGRSGHHASASSARLRSTASRSRLRRLARALRGELSPTLRRFATAESLAHLERLVREGRAERAEPRYVRAQPAPRTPAWASAPRDTPSSLSRGSRRPRSRRA